MKYNNEFNAKKYDRVTIMLPKGQKERLKALAAARGESVNSYIIRAIDTQEAAETVQERAPSLAPSDPAPSPTAGARSDSADRDETGASKMSE